MSSVWLLKTIWSPQATLDWNLKFFPCKYLNKDNKKGLAKPFSFYGFKQLQHPESNFETRGAPSPWPSLIEANEQIRIYLLGCPVTPRSPHPRSSMFIRIIFGFITPACPEHCSTSTIIIIIFCSVISNILSRCNLYNETRHSYLCSLAIAGQTAEFSLLQLNSNQTITNYLSTAGKSFNIWC